jgi:release factor glutamine methyltransferase
MAVRIPALDAQLWLAHVCGLTRAQLLARPERVVTPAQAARFSAGLARLAAGEPLRYLTGRAEFHGLAFRVSPATLIPRPETEHLVDAALELIPDAAPSGFLVADIGAGSGCIAVTLAVKRPAIHVFAVDVSSAALERNAEQHGVAKRITFLPGHLLAPLPVQVDLIAANLPYVADREWDDLPISVREYEPAGALRGGTEGLDLIVELLEQAPSALHSGGSILLEIGAAQGLAALALAQCRCPAGTVRLEQDYAGRDRLLTIQT